MTILEIILTVYLASIFLYIILINHEITQAIHNKEFESLDETFSLWLVTLRAILLAPIVLPITLIKYIIELFR